MSGTFILTWSDMFLCAAMGYLLGSIPFGYLITQLAGLGDVRKIGSGNIGATNVLRTGKKWAAVLTLVLDAGKGAGAVLLGQLLWGIEGAMIAGTAAMLGHIFPVWLRFKGGKGVAAFMGVMLGLYWPTGLLAIATWLLIAWFFRISSLSALVAAALAPAYTIALGNLPLALLTLVLSAIIFLTHHDNIYRIWHRQEPRIGAGKNGI
jgi:acyl phosphate:glycerol-3-phosphate acyltransferase